MSVTTFNNALGMNLKREVLEGRTTGVHKLYNTPLNSNYVYVWLTICSEFVKTFVLHFFFKIVPTLIFIF